MEVCPKQFAIHPLHHMKKMMVIVPINTNVNKTQYITDEHGNQRSKIVDIIRMRDFQFEDHNRDNDGKNAITKSFESVFLHREKLRGVLVYAQFRKKLAQDASATYIDTCCRV